MRVLAVTQSREMKGEGVNKLDRILLTNFSMSYRNKS